VVLGVVAGMIVGGAGEPGTAGELVVAHAEKSSAPTLPRRAGVISRPT
jgi:hypothetical protein